MNVWMTATVWLLCTDPDVFPSSVEETHTKSYLACFRGIDPTKIVEPQISLFTFYLHIVYVTV